MTYELWDFDTGNFIEDYASREAALRVVHEAYERDGDKTLDGLTLLEVDADGESWIVAQERDLLRLIQAGA